MKEADRDLMNALGDAIRAPDWLDDDLLERIAAGVATAAEIEDLRRAAAPDPRFDEIVAVLAAPSSPLEARVLETMDASSKTLGEREEAVVVPIERRRGRLWKPAIAVSLTAAAAAAVVLVVARGGDIPDLPEYQLELVGGERTMRAAGDAPARVPVFEPRSLVSVRMRPATRFEDSVFVHGFLFDAAGSSPRRLRLSPRFSSSGTIAIEGTASELFGDAAGSFLLAVVVARDDLDAPAPSDLARLESECAKTGASLRVARLELRR